MLNYRPNKLLLSALVLSLFAYGCSTKVEAPKTNYIAQTAGPEQISTIPSENLSNNNSPAEINLDQETEIEKSCLAAWRKCTSGHAKEGIAALKRLGKEYPKSSSVLFMTGQALDKFGDKNDKKEAIAYYEKAANNSDFAIMSLFKIAESLRTAGNTELAIVRYRKLISIAPQFVVAHLGLAKALMKSNPDSPEIKKELTIALKLEPSNIEASRLLSAKSTSSK